MTSSSEPRGMLAGLRIVEICAIGPGPFCAMHLADLGADVIAIERPNSAASPSGYVLNRGKRSVVVDLKTAQGRELVLSLVEHADALIEGMRPGVMERLGLGPEPCHQRNPRLVYGRMTGWGQTGPMVNAAGHDNNYIALSGALYYAGTASEPPSSPFTMVGDVGGGALYLAVGILAGVLNARATGQGTVVDAAVVDGSAHMLQLLLSTRAKGYIDPERGRSMHDGSHFYATYRCADGRFITIGAIEPQFYAELLSRLGLGDDPNYQSQWRREDWPCRQREMAALFATRTRDAWCALLEGSDVCFAPVLSPDEAARHPHIRARHVYFERDGRLEPAPAPRFDGRVATPGCVPRQDQHGDAIRQALHEGGAERVWRVP